LSVTLASLSLGIGPIQGVLLGEIIPVQIKNSMNGVLNALAWVASMSAAATFLPMKANLGLAGTFWLYAGFCFLLMLVFYLCVPETNGHSLGTIERELTSKSTELDFNKNEAVVL
jgi:hypothetical protein